MPSINLIVYLLMYLFIYICFCSFVWQNQNIILIRILVYSYSFQCVIFASLRAKTYSRAMFCVISNYYRLVKVRGSFAIKNDIPDNTMLYNRSIFS